MTLSFLFSEIVDGEKPLSSTVTVNSFLLSCGVGDAVTIDCGMVVTGTTAVTDADTSVTVVTGAGTCAGGGAEEVQPAVIYATIITLINSSLYPFLSGIFSIMYYLMLIRWGTRVSCMGRNIKIPNVVEKAWMLTIAPEKRNYT